MATTPAKPSKEQAESFTHKPLDTSQPIIRTIEILTIPKTIQCTLRHTLLSDDHICLSYMWGDDEPTHQIHINGKPFLVRSNLFAFLNEARRQRIYGPFWIDAICIDLSNDAERCQQVQLMGHFYGSAKQVLMYPGSVPTNLKPVVKYLTWSQNVKSSLNDKFGLRGLLATTSYSDLYYMITGQWRKRMAQQLSLLPYWKRLWIFQEVLLARNATLMLNGSLIPWRHIVDFVGDIDMPRAHGEASVQKYVPFWNLAQMRDPTSHSLADLLREVLYHDCSDFHDRIYGVAGFLPDPRALTVTYDADKVAMMLRVTKESNAFGPPNSSFMKTLGAVGEALRVFWTLVCTSCFNDMSENDKEILCPGFWPMWNDEDVQVMVLGSEERRIRLQGIEDFKYNGIVEGFISGKCQVCGRKHTPLTPKSIKSSSTKRALGISYEIDPT